MSLASLELDKCHKCDGIWCDRGEMERLRDAKRTEIEQMLEQRYGDPSCKAGKTEGYMLCPRCRDARLQEHSYTYIASVRIDRCERCFGIWLDDEELSRIAGEKKDLDELVPRLRALLRFIAKGLRR